MIMHYTIYFKTHSQSIMLSASAQPKWIAVGDSQHVTKYLSHVLSVHFKIVFGRKCVEITCVNSF